MAHWLFKSEPSAWSYEKVAGLGAAGTDWSGVRNHTAKLNMQAMKVGEQAFFYHSNEGKAVVGIVEICKSYRPDPTDATGKFGMVDIRAVRPLPRPVTLEEVKNDKRLAKMALVTQSRLSVQPVTDAEWAIVCELGGLYDDDQPRAAGLRMAQEPAERLMRLGLGQPMQIERGVDRGASAREFTLEPPFDRRERRRGGLRRSACRGLGWDRRRSRGPRGAHRIRCCGEGRPAPPRNAARNLGPERDLLVGQAPQTLRAGRRFLHGSYPRGRSTKKSAR